MIVWYHLIDNATSSAEIVAAARDYFASWTPQEISMLPDRCRPGKLRDASDIEFLHDVVVDEYRTSHLSGDALSRLQELTSFLVRATHHIGELSEGHDSPQGSRQALNAGESPES